MATDLTGIARLRIRARHAVFRANRRAARQFGDIELWQLRSVERAFQGAHGPDVLIIGDSTMFWIGRKEPDNRQLAEMISDELGPGIRCLTVVGPGYHAAMAMAYLSALTHSRSRPRVVVVPLTPMMATSPWLDHPSYPYQQLAEGMRAALASNGSRPRRLERPGHDYANEYDQRPAPSFVDSGRTLGELRMLIHAPAETRSQKAMRLRHRFDYYYAETLEPDSPGVKLVAQLADMLASMELPSVAYISPVNHEALAESLGQVACDHEARNAAVIGAAYLNRTGSLGALIDPSFDFPRDNFVDPLHPGWHARRQVAARIAAAVSSHLQRNR
jgi:hypothetical protein